MRCLCESQYSLSPNATVLLTLGHICFITYFLFSVDKPLNNNLPCANTVHKENSAVNQSQLKGAYIIHDTQ